MLVSENGQTMATALAAALQYILAVGGLHTLTETVNTQAAAIFRLECSLHFGTTNSSGVDCPKGQHTRRRFLHNSRNFRR